MKVKEVAIKMLDKNSKERKIAEKMFGKKFEEMMFAISVTENLHRTFLKRL